MDLTKAPPDHLLFLFRELNHKRGADAGGVYSKGWFELEFYWGQRHEFKRVRRKELIRKIEDLRFAVWRDEYCNNSVVAELQEMDYWAARDVETGHQAVPSCYFE